MELGLYIIFSLWAIVCVTSWIMQGVLYRRIKETHHAKWVALGEPIEPVKYFASVFTTAPSDLSTLLRTFRAIFRVLKYFLRGDAELDADGHIRTLKRINAALLALLLILFVQFIFVGLALTFPPSQL